MQRGSPKMLHCIFVAPIIFLALLPGANLLAITSSVEDRDTLYVCEGEDVDFPWELTTSSSGKTVTSIRWFHSAEERTLIAENAGKFEASPNYTQRLSPLGTAGIRLSSVSAADEGNYVVRVSGQDETGNPVDLRRTLGLEVISDDDAPVLSGGRLQMEQSPTAVKRNRQWHLELTCGTFTSLGKPPAHVFWTTPSGSTVSTSGYSDGNFRLLLSSPVRSGNYSCAIPQDSPAVLCLSPGNTVLRAANLAVVEAPSKVTLVDGDDVCEAREAENEHLRTELDQQEQDVERLQDENRQLENTIDGLRSDNSQLQSANQELQEENDQLENEIHTLRDELDQMKDCSEEDETGRAVALTGTDDSSVAVGKPASQSSTFRVGYTDASLAVDDDREGSLSCSITANLDYNPWWQVDLGQEMTVTKVDVSQQCCFTAAVNLRLFLVAYPRLAVFTSFGKFDVTVYTQDPRAFQNAKGVTLSCSSLSGHVVHCDDSTRGRYVRVSQSDASLRLCEVQITAHV